MAPPKSSDAEALQASLDYIVLLISKSEFKPDFHATAQASGITSANNAYASYNLITTASADSCLARRDTKRSWNKVASTNLSRVNWRRWRPRRRKKAEDAWDQAWHKLMPKFEHGVPQGVKQRCEDGHHPRCGWRMVIRTSRALDHQLRLRFFLN